METIQVFFSHFWWALLIVPIISIIFIVYGLIMDKGKDFLEFGIKFFLSSVILSLAIYLIF